MTPPSFQPTRKPIKTWILISLGIIVFLAVIIFGTLTILQRIKAPVASRSVSGQPATTTPVLSAAEAQAVADKAKASAIDKVAKGDQKGALVDYQAAYTNYKLAGNIAAANDALFAVNSIKAVEAAPQNPGKPAGAKASTK
ncbi:MAG: hypothetical protein ACHQTE_01720 [Candidatus Saccharimonadales bacterium]